MILRTSLLTAKSQEDEENGARRRCRLQEYEREITSEVVFLNIFELLAVKSSDGVKSEHFGEQ